MQAGRTWQNRLIQPAVEGLLLLRSGERVLEIACGNGEFARRMKELDLHVLATDFSENMLERARAHGGDIDYLPADATDEGALLALGEPGSFDAVVSNMAIMDMESIEPMVAAAARLLGPNGRFVFSTLHPSFNSGDVRPMVRARSGQRRHGGVLGQCHRVWSRLRPQGRCPAGSAGPAVILPPAALDDPGTVLRPRVRAGWLGRATHPARRGDAGNARVRIHADPWRARGTDASRRTVTGRRGRHSRDRHRLQEARRKITTG
jgi:SAM-dependent methyltransferase